MLETVLNVYFITCDTFSRILYYYKFIFKNNISLYYHFLSFKHIFAGMLLFSDQINAGLMSHNTFISKTL